MASHEALKFLLIVVLMTVCLVAATPFILLGSFFGGSGYIENVRDGYTNVVAFWSEHLGG